MADTYDTRTWIKSKSDLCFLSDRLFGAGITSLALRDTPRFRQDLVDASRAITRLIGLYEREVHRELIELKLGGCV